MRIGDLLSWNIFMSAGAAGDGGGGGNGADGSGDGGDGEPAGSGDSAGAAGASSGLGSGGAAGGGAPNGGPHREGGNLPTVPDYAQGFADVELQNWLSNKGERWPTLESVIKSHMDLEKLRGVPADELIQLSPIDNEQAWHGDGGIFEKLGRPKTADQYDLPELDADTLKDGKTMDLTVPFRAAMFANGVSKGATEAVAKVVLDAMGQFDTDATQTTHIGIQKDLGILRAEWGTEYDANLEVAKRGARAIGFDVDSEKGLTGQLFELEKVIGTRTFISKMHNIGSMIGEHGGGDHGGGGADPGFMSASSAQERIDQLSQDEAWTRGYLEGNPEKVAEMNKLQAFANPPRPR